jgi:hypothetical protein
VPQKGFLGSLFDLSFTSFVTTKLIKLLYVLSLVLLGLGYLFIAAAAFNDSGGAGVLWLFILGPLVIFFYLLLYRVFFELVMVVFRIFENTRDQLAVTRAAWPAEAAAAPARVDEQPPPTAPMPV